MARAVAKVAFAWTVHATLVPARELELSLEQWRRISDAGDLGLGSTAYLYS